MRVRSCVISLCALVLLGILTAATAAAMPFDKRTTFTFNGPIAIPGVTLPAGSYLFRLADSSSRNVVQVLSADGKTPYAMFFSLRSYRTKPAKDGELSFMETASDMPAAIKTWWYAGESSGYDFVYPREQARLLAKGSGKPVLSTEAVPYREEPEFEWVTPDEALEPPAPALTPEEPVVVAEVAEEPVEVAAQEPAPVNLPKSDSPTATLLLVGFGALLTALGVRAARAAL